MAKTLAERQADYRARQTAALARRTAGLVRIGQLVEGRTGEVALEVAAIVKTALA